LWDYGAWSKGLGRRSVEYVKEQIEAAGVPIF